MYSQEQYVWVCCLFGWEGFYYYYFFLSYIEEQNKQKGDPVIYGEMNANGYSYYKGHPALNTVNISEVQAIQVKVIN